jgi:hypothetical protein
MLKRPPNREGAFQILTSHNMGFLRPKRGAASNIWLWALADGSSGSRQRRSSAGSEVSSRTDGKLLSSPVIAMWRRPRDPCKSAELISSIYDIGPGEHAEACLFPVNVEAVSIP